MPSKYNKGLSAKRLFFKYTIDTWGHFLLKKNFKSRAPRRLLFFFEDRLRFGVVKLLKPFRFSTRSDEFRERQRRRREFRRERRRRLFRRGKRYQRKKSTRKPRVPRSLRPQQPLPVKITGRRRPHKIVNHLFFRNLFRYYSALKKFNARQNSLISF